MPGTEIWSSGFWLVGSGSTTSAELTSLAAAVATVLQDTSHPGGMTEVATVLWNGLTNWNKISAYYYAGGSDKSAAVGEHFISPPLAGATGGGLPNQVASVMSLRTDLTGRSHRGRMFMPATGVSLNEDGQMSTAPVVALAQNWAWTFGQLKGFGYGTPSIVSAKLDTTTPISSVVVTTKLEVMRSRANHQAYNYEYVSGVPSS